MKNIFLIVLILCLTVSGQSMAQNNGPDYDGDTDVDGSDLGEYAERIQIGTATLTMGLFALNFGKNSYLAINDFTQYYSHARLLRDGNDIFEEINATTKATSGEVNYNCENKYPSGSPPPWETGCTFYREIIVENGENQIVPIGVNVMRLHLSCWDWDDLGGVDAHKITSVVLASGRVVNRTDFSGISPQTVRLDGTPFDFEQWYGEEITLTMATTWCDENIPCDENVPVCTLCSEDLWAVSSYNDPIVEVIITKMPNSVGSTSLCGGDTQLQLFAYGDSIDLSYPGSLWDGAKTVFVTRETYPADGFGGLQGADTICNAEAQAAGLEGEFVALLSGIYDSWDFRPEDPPGTPTVNPGAEIPRDVRYVLPDGTNVMKSIEITEGEGPLLPINKDAFGQPVNGSVWTGTFVGGVRACPGGLPACFTCGSNITSRTDDWTRSDIWGGVIGNTEATDGTWLEDQIIHCAQEAALYCFEK